jgi:hypothetical protein
MSTSLKSRLADQYYLTRFSGGIERGVCVQVTPKAKEHGCYYIALTKAEAKDMIKDLQDFVNNKSVSLE